MARDPALTAVAIPSPIDSYWENAGACSTSEVVTRASFQASPENVWDALMFYEQIDERSPLCLRLLLPVPVRTEGRKLEAGKEVRCVYENGHLRKRITRANRGQSLAFTITEQNIALHKIKLLGGSYVLRGINGETEVALKTEYTSNNQPRWLWISIETFVCHTFHRHILNAIRRKMEQEMIIKVARK